jgi:hypothetical protein
MANRFYIRRRDPGGAGRILPVIRTDAGLCLSTTIYAPLPQADDLTEAEAQQVRDLLAIGTYERVNPETGEALLC